MDEVTKRSVDRAICTLNRALEADPEAMNALFNFRVPCNNELAYDPTIQVREIDGKSSVSALGLINGLFGIRDDGYGHIGCVVHRDDPAGPFTIDKFDHTTEAMAA